MADELKPVYLLAGGDRPKIRRALERLRARFGPDAVERLSAADASGDDAAATCNALGLFAGTGRLVIVEDAERWKAADVKAVASYLASPAPSTVLALVAGELKSDSQLAKACANAGDVLVYDVPKRDLPRWVAGEFRRLGSEADPEACATLVEIVGDNFEELSNEIAKLATWAAGDTVGERDVEALVAARSEAPAFALTDAWGRRDVGGVLRAADVQLERAADGRRELTRLVAVLASHVSRVRSCQALDAGGVGPRDAAAQLNRHRFYVEKLYAQARNFTADELRDAIVRLADLDQALKGGSRLPGELEVVRALVGVTRGAATNPVAG